MDQQQNPYDALESKLASLRKEASFESTARMVEQLDDAFAALSNDLPALRAARFGFKKHLEPTAVELQNQWVQSRPQVHSLIQRFRMEDQARVEALGGQLMAMGRAIPADRAEALRRQMDALDSEMDAHRNQGKKLYGPVEDRLDKLVAEVRALKEFAAKAEPIQSTMLEGESFVDAVAATLLNDKAKLDGTLFLTDLRMLWVHAKVVVLEKGLIFDKKETRHEVEIDELLQNVTNVGESEKGLIFKDEILEISSSGRTGRAKWKLGADSKAWKELILRAKARGLEGDRATRTVLPSLPPYVPGAPATPPGWGTPQAVPAGMPAPGAYGAPNTGYPAYPGVPQAPVAAQGYPPPPAAAGYPPAPAAGYPPPAPAGYPPPAPAGYPPPAPAGYPPPPPPGYAPAPPLQPQQPMPPMPPMPPAAPQPPAWPGAPAGGAVPPPLPGGGAYAGAPAYPAAANPYAQPPLPPGALPVSPGNAAYPSYMGIPHNPQAHGPNFLVCLTCSSHMAAPPNRGVNLICPQCRQMVLF